VNYIIKNIQIELMKYILILFITIFLMPVVQSVKAQTVLDEIGEAIQNKTSKMQIPDPSNKDKYKNYDPGNISDSTGNMTAGQGKALKNTVGNATQYKNNTSFDPGAPVREYSLNASQQEGGLT
jgi:hypothetical protein